MFLGGGLTYGILLLALGVGYIVCYLANREDKRLRSLGLIIGAVIIAVSTLMLLNNLLLSAQMCGSMRGGMGAMMPMHKMMKAGKVPSVKGAKAMQMAPAQQPEQKK